jgi:Zn-dependent peptidase ImmA (M78 family)/transcriptional regulator with XRE-family HTH domain
MIFGATFGAYPSTRVGVYARTPSRHTERVPPTRQEPRSLTPRSPESPFQPGRLRLARELTNTSQADLKQATRLSAAAISQFESGATKPSTRVVDQLSEALDTPADFFYRPMTDTHEGFFRSLRRTSVTDRRRARAFAHLVHDLAVNDTSGALADLDVPNIPVTDLDAGPEVAASAAREVRRIWRLPAGPVNNVVRTLEDHGIVVIRLPLDTADVDAFSLPFDDRPVVVLGSDKNDRARSRFDTAHELGHLVMHGQQVWGVKEVEQQAHAFAAEFLMPADDIREQLPARADWPTLFKLKQHWQVSLAALLMRAKTLKRMDDAAYLTGVKAASTRGWRRSEPVPLGPPETPERTDKLRRTQTGRQAAQWLPATFLGQLAEATTG